MTGWTVQVLVMWVRRSLQLRFGSDEQIEPVLPVGGRAGEIQRLKAGWKLSADFESAVQGDIKDSPVRIEQFLAPGWRSSVSCIAAHTFPPTGR